MPHQRIITAGNAVAQLLPREVWDTMELDVGDDVELSIVDRTLIIRPLDEAEHAQKLEVVTQTVFTRRQSAYERLAQGVE